MTRPPPHDKYLPPFTVVVEGANPPLSPDDLEAMSAVYRLSGKDAVIEMLIKLEIQGFRYRIAYGSTLAGNETIQVGPIARIRLDEEQRLREDERHTLRRRDYSR